MYILAVQRRFEATHHLIGGDWGAENLPHSHAYRLEVRLEGEKLNQHGYLVDIVEVESRLDQLLKTYGGSDLNELPEFAGLNPSIEHFSRILCQALAEQLDGSGPQVIAVQLWENDAAWASYRQDL
ncbi:MAG: 6-carboxytetrahydropterin synthase [Anaerolineales bacterium]